MTFIIDFRPDPFGSGEGLFTMEFYGNCCCIALIRSTACSSNQQ